VLVFRACIGQSVALSHRLGMYIDRWTPRQPAPVFLPSHTPNPCPSYTLQSPSVRPAQRYSPAIEEKTTTTRASSTALFREMGSGTRYRAGHLARLQEPQARGRMSCVHVSQRCGSAHLTLLRCVPGAHRSRGMHLTSIHRERETARARARVLVACALRVCVRDHCAMSVPTSRSLRSMRSENEDETSALLPSWPTLHVFLVCPARILVRTLHLIPGSPPICAGNTHPQPMCRCIAAR
jgi:hypothetical protein